MPISTVAELKKVLDYLLYMTIDDEPYKFEQLHSKIRNFNSAQHSYTYNVNVLIRLLENEYIQRELET